MLRKMKLGLCAVLCLMIIYVLGVCNAKCDEYIVVFEEHTYPVYRLTPLKKRDINWGDVSYPSNSTDTNPKKKKCIVEFDCTGTTFSCQNHIKVVNHQTHTLIKDNHTAKLIENRTKTLDEPKIYIIENEKPNRTVKEEFNSTYDINIIYVYDDKIQNSSETNKSKLKDQILQCDYAETVCVDEGNPENNSLSDVKHETLKISINRDETSQVQPIFTGYFPHLTNNTEPHKYNNHFINLKTVILECKNFKDKYCTPSIDNKYLKLINIHIKTNYIQNNTITKYPNCTKDTIISDKKLDVKCEDKLFTKHNKHILLTPPPKQEFTTWSCRITKRNELLSNKEKDSKIYFKNCFNTNNKNTVSPTSHSVNKTILDNNAEDSIEKKGINKDSLSQIDPKNVITIHVTENETNCSNKPSLDIHDGKIIDLGVHNKDKILQKNNVELIISNCINANISIINETQPHQKAELSILLKNESLNTTNFKQFNGTLKEENDIQRILLRCDHPNLDSNSNTTINKTMLQCESIDLNLYNITGIEITTNINPLSNANNTKAQKTDNVNIGEEKKNKTKEVNTEVNKNSTISLNKTVPYNETTDNNKSTENNTKVVENKTVPDKVSEKKEMSITLNFNRKKDIPNGAGENSHAQESADVEKIMLITLLTTAGASILMVVALRICTKKTEYNVAPTREPPDEEETAF